MKPSQLVCAAAVAAAVGCHPGPVIDTGPRPQVGGTIAGIVSTDVNTPVAGRRVTAISIDTGARFQETTGTNGGFTIKVPEGRYRLELELQAGETITKQPEETRVNRSDLDPKRDFVIRQGG
jgi:hypothetical protein